MPDSLLLAATTLGVFVATTVLVLALTTPIETPVMRLARYARYTGRRGSPGAEAEYLSFRERLIEPTFDSIIAWMARAAPSELHRTVAAELTMAGSRMSPTAFLGIRTLLLFGMPALGILYVLGTGPIEPLDLVVLLLAVVWGRQLPTMWLKRRIRSRQRAIDRRLPYALDLMVACLEGGLSIDAALAKVVEQSDGPLAMEIRRTLQELALGRPTSEAIRDLGERTGAQALNASPKTSCNPIAWASASPRVCASWPGTLASSAVSKPKSWPAKPPSRWSPS